VKYVLLNTRPSGMSREVARQQMLAAKNRCGNSAGKLSLTHPDGDGNYCAGFENDQHADEFIRFLGRQNVRYTVPDPRKIKLRDRPLNDDFVIMLIEVAERSSRRGRGIDGRGPFPRQ
jgi:hypothetical protein